MQSLQSSPPAGHAPPRFAIVNIVKTSRTPFHFSPMHRAHQLQKPPPINLTPEAKPFAICSSATPIPRHAEPCFAIVHIVKTPLPNVPAPRPAMLTQPSRKPFPPKDLRQIPFERPPFYSVTPDLRRNCGNPSLSAQNAPYQPLACPPLSRHHAARHAPPGYVFTAFFEQMPPSTVILSPQVAETAACQARCGRLVSAPHAPAPSRKRGR